MVAVGAMDAMATMDAMGAMDAMDMVVFPVSEVWRVIVFFYFCKASSSRLRPRARDCVKKLLRV